MELERKSQKIQLVMPKYKVSQLFIRQVGQPTRNGQISGNMQLFKTES